MVHIGPLGLYQSHLIIGPLGLSSSLSSASSSLSLHRLLILICSSGTQKHLCAILKKHVCISTIIVIIAIVVAITSIVAPTSLSWQSPPSLPRHHCRGHRLSHCLAPAEYLWVRASLATRDPGYSDRSTYNQADRITTIMIIWVVPLQEEAPCLCAHVPRVHLAPRVPLGRMGPKP